MKTLFFSLIVVISGYYLLSQTDSGHALLSKVMPSQQIEQTTDELLNKVDSRLQDFANSQSAEQNLKIQQLEQQVNELTTLLANQKTMQQRQELTQQSKSRTEPLTTQTTAAPKETQTADNDVLQLPPDLSQIKGQTASDAANAYANFTINTQGSDTAASKTLQRQKQASLQDIAARMEQVSLQISEGNF